MPSKKAFPAIHILRKRPVGNDSLAAWKGTATSRESYKALRVTRSFSLALELDTQVGVIFVDLPGKRATLTAIANHGS